MSKPITTGCDVAEGAIQPSLVLRRMNWCFQSSGDGGRECRYLGTLHHQTIPARRKNEDPTGEVRAPQKRNIAEGSSCRSRKHAFHRDKRRSAAYRDGIRLQPNIHHRTQRQIPRFADWFREVHTKPSPKSDCSTVPLQQRPHCCAETLAGTEERKT